MTAPDALSTTLTLAILASAWWCCGCATGSGCTQCTDRKVPDTVDVAISGFAADNCTDGACPNYDGTYTCTYTGDATTCEWSGAGGGSAGRWAGALCSTGSLSVSVTLFTDLVRVTVAVNDGTDNRETYTFEATPTTPIDCCAMNQTPTYDSMTYHGAAACDGSAATVTITGNNDGTDC